VSDDCTIYIVDDDACVRRALSRLLAASGYGVVTCESAEAHLELPSLARPSCLIVDIRMPGSTGLELQHALRDGANPPIVMLSGHADTTIAERAVACGAIAVLLKPVDESLLLSALESALDRDRQTIANARGRERADAPLRSLRDQQDAPRQP
jgi:FixJ family two-component response regulator